VLSLDGLTGGSPRVLAHDGQPADIAVDATKLPC
jgi:hypothetical protein